MKIDKVLDELLVFMKNEIEKHGSNLDGLSFNFSQSEIVPYINAPDEVKPEGEDLTAFKKKHKYSDDLILQSLNKALTDSYIRSRIMSNKYEKLILNELGAARAESTKHNKKTLYTRALNYFTEKLLVPIVTAVLTALIVNYISDSQTDKEIKKIKEDIEWLKTYQNKSH
jgi:hypothetical protein